ncbi:ATP phosphoribosyltransferase, partial [Bacillus thuringiensis]|nr:ATP phosphoribosyltransferase [Bacillus thuringiensis]
MRNIQIALTKGRLEKHVIPLFEQIGIDCSELKNKGRKLVFQSKNTNVSFILVKAVDVATYVEHGVADIGIVGKDILMENEKDIYEMLDLGVGICKFCVASI